MAYDGTLKFDTSVDSSGFQTGINKISSIASTGLKATTAILTGAGTAIMGIGTAAAKVGMDFEAGMSNVAAISGATGKDLEDLTAKAKEMGSKTKFSATESAQAFSYMAMAGWKTGDMLDGIEGIMNLAAASGEDLATTSDIVTDALTAFGLSAGDSGHFADILAAASSNANTNVGLMGETFKYVAPVAGALGFSAEDTATAIGLMANAGIKGSQAGTSLRAIMSRMAKPTKEVQGAMDSLGVSLTNSDGSMKSLNEIMGDLRKGFDGLSESEKAEMAAALGGQEAMSGLLAIVNASDEDYEKLQTAINGATDEMTGYSAAAEMAETMNDNLQGQITILKSGLEGLGISLYENMQGPLKEVVKEAQNMVSQLQTAFDEGGLQGMVEAVGSVLAQIVQKVAEAAPSLINAAVGLVGSFCDGLKTQTGITEAGATLITSLCTALFECAGDIWTTAITLIGQLAGGIAAGAPQVIQAAANCITDIIQAIIDNLPLVIDAGVQILQALVDGISNMLPTLMSQAVTLVTTIATKLVENLPTIVNCAIQLVQALISGLISALPDLLAGAVQLFQAIVDAIPIIIEQLLQALPNIITSIVNFLVAALPQIVQAAVQMLNGLIDAIPTIVSAIAENLPQIITAIVNGLTTALPQILEAAITLLMAIIQAIPDIVVAIAENLPQIITAIASGLGQAIPQIFEAGKNLLWQIIEAVPEIVTGLAGAVPDIIAGIVNGLVGGVQAVFQAACDLGKGILNGIKSFFGINSPSTVMKEQGDYLVQGMINGLSALPAKAMQCLTDTLNNVVQWGANLLNKAKEIATNTVTNVVNFFSQLPGKILQHLTTALTNITTWGSNILNTAKTAASNVVSSVTNFFSQLPGKIQQHLSTIISNVTSWASNMLSKAKTAASNVVSNVTSTISQLPGKVATQLTNVISKVTSFATNFVSKAKTAATNAVSNFTSSVSQLPGKIASTLSSVISKVTSFGSNIVSNFRSIGSNVINGLIGGIGSMVGNLYGSIKNALSGLVSKAKSALGINSPSKVFAEEIGEWIPPGIGEGVESSMPALLRSADSEMQALADKMKATVTMETGKIELDKNIAQTYKVERENGQSFDENKTEVNISGDIHTHVELDGKEVGNSTTPIVDQNMARIDTHKKRGG